MRTYALCAGLLFIAFTGAATGAPCAGFTDVDDSSQFCTNVEWIKSRNITLGCATPAGGGAGPRYCPNDPVSRLAMAAFLNRLGDLLLPPNVIWVAPVGGRFQSIQEAIDLAAVGASATQRRLIKLAPGEYAGPIQMANFVDIEGSGYAASVITGDCSAPTVTLAMRARLREVLIRSGGEGQPLCVGAKLTTVPSIEPRHPLLRDVAIEVSAGAASSGPSSIGLSILAGADADLEFRNVNITVSGGLQSYGVLVDTFPGPAPLTTMLLHDGRIWASFGGLGSAYGIAAARSMVTVDRVDIRTGGLAGPSYMAAATRQSRIGIRDSSLGSLTGTMSVDADSAITLTNTELVTSTHPWPGVSCYNVYGRGDTVVPIAC